MYKSCGKRYPEKICLFVFFTISVSIAKGNHYTDTGRKVLLASVDKKERARFIIKEPNIVFPKLLCGNEEFAVDYIEKFSANRRDYIIRTYNKGKKYFPKAAAILKRYNLPPELKVLIALESAFNANAVSKAGAVGYWQFMTETAREYGLKVAEPIAKQIKSKLIKKDKKKAEAYFKKLAKQKDDRRNFNKSTSAAARYLNDRGRNLNHDLLLMVASYNCGIGNVWDAMAASGKTDPTFWDIKDQLPAETRAYVMNFITLNVLFHNYDKFTDNSLSFKPEKIMLTNSDEHIISELQ